MKMKRRAMVKLLMVGAVLAAAPLRADDVPASPLQPANPLLIRSGETLAFMGDSITDFADDKPAGYCRLVIDGLRQYGVDVKPLYVGHGGDRSADMLARLDRDVIAKKPDWMTLNCGVNDAWGYKRGNRGIPVDQYAENVTEIVDRCEAAGIRVILLTPSIIGEDNLDNESNNLLPPYVEWMRRFAEERNLPLADIHAMMYEGLEADPMPGFKQRYTFTGDGVHLQPRGHRLFARGILRAAGLTDSEISALYDRWLDWPGGWIVGAGLREVETDADGRRLIYDFGVQTAITAREFIYLEYANRTVAQFAVPKEKVIPKLLKKNGGPYDSIKAIVQSPDRDEIQAEAQRESERVLAEEVAAAKAKYEAHVAALSEKERRTLDESIYR